MANKNKLRCPHGNFKAQLRIYKGTPTIFVNGKPIYGGAILFRNDPVNSGRFRYDLPSLRMADPEIVMIYANLEVGSIQKFSIIEDWMAQTFSQHPNALGACHIGIQPSLEWANSHPEEMTVYDKPVDRLKSRCCDPSWASEKWREDSTRFIEELSKQLHQKFLGKVILYQVGSGSCAENVPVLNPYTGYSNGGWFCGDFSNPMLRYFRHKLREYYNGNIDRLQAAWGNPKVIFESAMPPTRIERMKTEWFALRSPKCSQTADFYRAWSEAIEDCAISWAKAIKRATNNEALTATPMGAILDSGLNSCMLHHQMKGTMAKSLKSKDLDMLESPASYALRNLGHGDCSAMIPLGSLRLAGKIWLRDFDTRTSIVLEKDSPVEKLWKNPSTPWEDVQILKRDISYSLLKGGSFWWHEIETKMYHLPEHIKTVKRSNSIGRGIIHADRSTPPGLAVFVDTESNFHQANSNRLIYAMNYEARRLHWTHAGMASETYLLDDALNPNIPEHKVIMVTNAFCITDKQHRAILKLARHSQAAVIWLMAPGVQTTKGFDLSHVSKITGFKIKSVDIEALPAISLIDSNHPWSQPTLTQGIKLKNFGAGPLDADDSGARNIGPMFYVDVSKDKDVTVLGILDVLCEPGLVVRKMDGYTSVYCSAPYIHNAMLRKIGKDSEAHIYVDTDDLIHASKDLLLINAKQDGIKKINLARKAQTIVNLYTGKEIADNCQQFSIKMKKHETSFFFAGSKSVSDKIHSRTVMSR